MVLANDPPMTKLDDRRLKTVPLLRFDVVYICLCISNR